MKRCKVYLEDIMNAHADMDYGQLYAYIMQKIENGELVPMKNAKTNGKKPALPLRFWKYEEETDYMDIYAELKIQVPSAAQHFLLQRTSGTL